MLHVEEPPTTSRSSDFRSDLEGLRAVAVLLVISDHLLGWPFGGFIGVDVFFVLSGFLITGLLVKEGERSGRVSIREFYARRVRRIMPAALLVLVTTTLAGSWVFAAGRAQDTLQDALWAGGFLANWHFADVGTDYFQEGLPPSALQHYWSLSVEEQFYVVWPVTILLLLVLGRRLRRVPVRRLVGGVAALVTAASFAYCVWLTRSAPTDAYFSTATRAWELSLGALLAVSAATLLRVPERVRAAASWLGLVGIVAASVVITAETPFPGSAAALPVVATGLVLAAGNPRGGPGRTVVLGGALPQYLGRLSYSLYLWHWPCIVLAAAYWGDSGIGYWLSAAVLPVLLAVVAHHAVEDPIRRSGWLSARPEGFRRRTVSAWFRDNRRGLEIALVGTAAAAFLVVGLVGLQGGTQADARAVPGTAQDPDAQLQRVVAGLALGSWDGLEDSLADLESEVSPEWKPDRCLNVLPENLDACVYGDPSGARTAVVLGDSVAAGWMQGIRVALAGEGWRIQMLTFGECPVPDLPTARKPSTRGIEFTECSEHRDWVVEQVERIRPDLLIASSSPAYAERIVGIDSTDAAANDAAWQRGMAARLEAVTPYAQRSVVLAAPPSSGNLQRCVSRRGSPQECVGAITRNWAGVAEAERQAAQDAGAAYVDSSAWLCHEARCPAVIDGFPVLRDGVHLTAEWSRRLGPLLKPVLLGTGTA